MTASSAMSRIILPLGGAILSLALIGFIAKDPASLRASRGVVGPGFWPTVMLIGMAICAALILVRNLLATASGITGWGAAAMTGPAFGGTQYDNRRAALGIVLVLVYGFAIPWVGFAIATFAFVAIWMILGEVRKPVTVAAVTILGTIVTLWFFAGVALMPLDLGRGAFESATIALYRALRIY